MYAYVCMCSSICHFPTVDGGKIDFTQKLRNNIDITRTPIHTHIKEHIY